MVIVTVLKKRLFWAHFPQQREGNILRTAGINCASVLYFVVLRMVAQIVLERLNGVQSLLVFSVTVITVAVL